MSDPGAPDPAGLNPDDVRAASDGRRAEMVRTQIAARGVRDEQVLAAMRSVPRELFVPEPRRDHAYEDHPLPIGEDQTISQPYIVALMAEAAGIGPGDRVLEVGTGSGYGAAVLSELAAHVWSIERLEGLAATARAVLADNGFDNVDVICGDGTAGWSPEAPYDAIVVTAAAPSVPDALVQQLADGARLVIPVGRHSGGQELLLVQRHGSRIEERDLGAVSFVPLIPDR